MQSSQECCEGPGREALPDFTLPLVEMAEMDRPVMVVTVTDIKMMSHVRAAGEDGLHRAEPCWQPHGLLPTPAAFIPRGHPPIPAWAVIQGRRR